MVAFADTGFIASLYLKESTSAQARAAVQASAVVLPLTPLGMLELRNAFNHAVQRGRITTAQRDALWQDVEADIESGFLVLTPISSDELHKKARQLDGRSKTVQPAERINGTDAKLQGNRDGADQTRPEILRERLEAETTSITGRRN